MEQKQYDCIIVGAGISGLSFAHYLVQQGKKVLVLEKNSTIGGEVQSAIFEEDKNYWRELGAHTCYNSYTHLLNIVKDLGVEKEIQQLNKGSYVIYGKGRIKSVMSELKFLSLLFNGVKLFFSSREGKTVEEYFGNIVGKGNYKHLFTRLFRAVLSQNADQYPAESFLKKRAGRDENFPRKFSFKKGQHHLLNLIVEKNNIQVLNNATSTDIQYNKENESFTISIEEGKYYTTNKLALATPPNISAQLIKGLEPQLANLLETIPMFHSQSMNVLVDKEKLKIKTVAGIIPTSDEFLSAVSRDLVENKKYRSFTFHFEEDSKTEEEQLDFICHVLKIDRNDILEKVSAKHILPSLRLSHLQMDKQVKAAQKNKNIYLVGNYFYGLSLEDCVNRSSDEAQRFLGIE